MKQNMTPKEKAKHLALKFTSSTDVVKPNLGSIKMALLCADEVLLTIIDIDDEGSLAYSWWNEVKHEINLL